MAKLLSAVLLADHALACSEEASSTATPASRAQGGDQMRERILEVLRELIEQQEKKLVATAARIAPRLTADDLLQPHDHPALARDPGFNYEDGLLAGLRSAQAALRATLADVAAR